MQITNTTGSIQIVRTKDGSDVEFAPGETKTVAVDKDQVRFAAELAAGVWQEAKAKSEAKPSSNDAVAARAAS